MTAALLAPAGLAALAALVLPLLIHLARRTQARPTDFAALRWLRPNPRPRRRPRLDERLLLAARLLLLAALALELAHPVLRGGADATRWVAVVPGVDPATALRLGGGARTVWLAPGLPELRDLRRPPPAGLQPFASLVRQLDADLPPGARLTVLVPAVLQGADAERPRLTHAVDWRALPGAMAAPKSPVEAAPSLVVREAPGDAAGLRYLRAAAAAWRVGPDAPASVAPVLVWLGTGRLPAELRDRVARGAVALTGPAAEVAGAGPGVAVWDDALGRPLLLKTTLGRGRVLRFARPLAPDVMPELLEPDFPDHLRAALAGPSRAPARVEARDYAPLAGGRAAASAAQDLRPELAGVVALLFALERGLATRRRRASPA